MDMETNYCRNRANRAHSSQRRTLDRRSVACFLSTVKNRTQQKGDSLEQGNMGKFASSRNEFCDNLVAEAHRPARI
jgi:hypothetical protein